MPAKPKLNEDQKEAFEALKKFIDHPAANTFVLKGYAGTGKTFLMQYFAQWLNEKKYKFSLLASTGRAAAVLRGKTGLTTRTVHGELYLFSRVDGAEDDLPDDAPIEQFGQMTMLFSIRPSDDTSKIYIIDESSMLSSERDNEDQSAVFFGSGNLLGDFFSSIGNNKVVFVGDPGQLPPVKQVFSPALDADWLAKEKRIAISTTLEKIERHNEGNDILVLAENIRSLSGITNLPAFPKLPARNRNNITLYEDDKALFNSYLSAFRQLGENAAIAIARSNKMVGHLNRALRRDLYGGLDLPLQPGDILLVTHNNYMVPLTNGDFVKVLEIGSQVIQGGLIFQSVKISALLSEIDFEILISLDILYGKENNFSRKQQKMLMVDFNRRMKKKGFKPNTEDYRDEMLSDPYLNCLRVKYGYAVTCHKAQGGEWNEVFLFLEKSMYGMQRAELFRWWYTAVTRARDRLHLTNNWWIC